MKLKLFFMLAIATFTLTYAQAQTVEEIVTKHVEAIGGADKLKTVTSIVTESSIAVQGMEIPNKNIVVIGKSLRTESTIMGNAMVQVLHGDKGWKIMPAMLGGSGEPEDLSAEEMKPLTGQLDPFGSLYNYQEKGNKVELVGKEKVDKKDMFHLKVTDKNGIVSDQFLDAGTYLLYKATTTVAGQTTEIVMSNYTNIEGLKMANTIDITSPMGAFTLVTSKTVLNGPVDEQVFAKPVK